MKSTVMMLALTAALICSTTQAAEPTVKEVDHWDLQAVDEFGEGIYNETDKVIVKGIILNNPEEMLDPTPGAPEFLGGQWQIFIQGEGGDHAGTAVWFGQYYSRVSTSEDYTDEELLDELYRINRDPNTAYVFQAGDRVRVEGYYKFFRGKMNINENHEKDPEFSFHITLLEPAVGLPQPEVVTLDELKDENDDFIFDHTRQTGPEYYQARRVRLNNVTIIDPDSWGPGNEIIVQDDDELTFPVKLGIGTGFSRYPAPAGPIDVIGIMNQEADSLPFDDGYHIWVVNYDGNGLVLTDRGRARGNLPGDINGDFRVDLLDFAELAQYWLSDVAGLYPPPQD